MRVLLTGASGFLGANCLRHMLNVTDWHIVCPAAFSHRGVPERITLTVQPDEWERVTVVTCDLATPIADTTATLFGDIDYIINFASESSVPRAIADPVHTVQNNVNLMLHLLEYARTLPRLRAFVQISTDEVYGPCAEGTHAEWSTILPSTPYSASKAAQEALAISYWRTFSLPLILVNTMNPIGPMQDPEKFVPTVIGKIRRREAVTIHTDRAGTVGSRVYVNTEDLASAILHVIGLGVWPKDAPPRWNVVGERDVDNLELAQLIASAMEAELSYNLRPGDAPGHGGRYALDGSKLAATGWKPAYTIEGTVGSVVAWTLDHPLWANRKPR